MSRKILRAAEAETPAQEMHRIVLDAIAMRRERGAQRAVASVARDLGLTESRVTQILRGNIGRVWADEWMTARAWYARELRLRADMADVQAEIYRQRSIGPMGGLSA